MNWISLAALLVFCAFAGGPSYAEAAGCGPGAGCCGTGGESSVGRPLFPNQPGLFGAGVVPASNPSRPVGVTRKPFGAGTNLAVQPKAAPKTTRVEKASPKTFATLSLSRLPLHGSLW
jgi:hypothetical protein